MFFGAIRTRLSGHLEMLDQASAFCRFRELSAGERCHVTSGHSFCVTLQLSSQTRIDSPGIMAFYLN